MPNNYPTKAPLSLHPKHTCSPIETHTYRDNMDKTNSISVPADFTDM